jgi:CO/xanthine dehydrogenase Mo-binding subunit
LLTGSLADYLLPTASDFPFIRAVALEEKPAPHNPLGAKGAGEGGIIPVGGVIANDVVLRSRDRTVALGATRRNIAPHVAKLEECVT